MRIKHEPDFLLFLFIFFWLLRELSTTICTVFQSTPLEPWCSRRRLKWVSSAIIWLNMAIVCLSIIAAATATDPWGPPGQVKWFICHISGVRDVNRVVCSIVRARLVASLLRDGTAKQEPHRWWNSTRSTYFVWWMLRRVLHTWSNRDTSLIWARTNNSLPFN